MLFRSKYITFLLRNLLRAESRLRARFLEIWCRSSPSDSSDDTSSTLVLALSSSAASISEPSSGSGVSTASWEAAGFLEILVSAVLSSWLGIVVLRREGTGIPVKRGSTGWLRRLQEGCEVIEIF